MFKTKKYVSAIYLSFLGFLLFTPITQNVWPQDEKEIKSPALISMGGLGKAFG